jgi:hypothetical protein
MQLSKVHPGWRMPATVTALIAVLMGYFWVHKPLDLALIATLGGSILDLFTASIILVIAAGLMSI